MNAKHSKPNDQHENLPEVEAIEPAQLPAEPLDFTRAPHEMTDGELVEALGIFFPRPPADPNAPPKPRPILDALKGGISEMIGKLIAEAGPVALPLLLQLLTKYLGQMGAAQAVAIRGAHDPYSYAKALQSRHVPATSETKAAYTAQAEAVGTLPDTAIWEAVVNLLLQFANELGPQLVPIILAAIKKLLGLPV